MWWLVFTAVDLYIGLIALDVMARSGSIPSHKLRGVAIAKKVLIAALVVTGVLLIFKIWRP
jgi:hypothetical protein